MSMDWRSALRSMVAGAGVCALVACGGGGGDPNSPSTPAKQEVKALPAGFVGNGVWWNPAQPGTGFMFEAQAPNGVATFFVFDESGRPVWYTASGPFSPAGTGKYVFSGVLQRYSDGQPLSSSTYRKPLSAPQGAIQIAFDGTNAQVQLPGRTFGATKFFAPGQGAPARPTQPETGIYWNPSEDGRGYVIEVSGDTAIVGVFHYAADGFPTWNLVVGSLASGSLKAPLTGYTGGQTLSGSFKPPSPVPATQELGIAFNDPCSGELTLPGRGVIAVRRFAFGPYQGVECRASNAPMYVPGAQTPRVPGVSVSLRAPLTLKTDVHVGRGFSIPDLNIGLEGKPGDVTGNAYHLAIEDPDFLVAGIRPTALYNLTSVTYGLSAAMTSHHVHQSGRRQGDLKIHVCGDPDCKRQYDGSPLVLPYDIQVFGIEADTQAILASSSFGTPVATRTVSITLPPQTTGFSARLASSASLLNPKAVILAGTQTVALSPPTSAASQATVSLAFPPMKVGVYTDILQLTIRSLSEGKTRELTKSIPVNVDVIAEGGTDYVFTPGDHVRLAIPAGTELIQEFSAGIITHPRATAFPRVIEYLSFPYAASGMPQARNWLGTSGSFHSAAVCLFAYEGKSCLPPGTYTARWPYEINKAGTSYRAYHLFTLEVTP